MNLKKAKRQNTDTKKYITFMLVPHSGKALFNFRIPEWIVKSFLLIVAGISLIFAGSLIYNTKLSAKLVTHKQLIKENIKQKEYITKFEKETKKIEKSVKKLEKEELKIRKLLGLPPKKENKGFSLFKFNNIYNNDKDKISMIMEKLNYLQDQLLFRSTSYAALKSSARSMNERFMHTTSIKPIDGPVISGFGYRFHPIMGYVRMHDGIDIRAGFGTPILAAASGTVVKSQWEGGYGYSILIDHGYGYTTRYSHNSRNLVSVGNVVKKGQVIAYAGSTGLATGTHLHYEVRKFDQPINPQTFLNLNIFTARKKVWYNNPS